MERNMLNPSPDPVTTLVLEKNLLSEISSMMKESKTANINISAGSSELSPNNEICFDSGKFPPTDPTKPRAAVASTLVRNTDNVPALSPGQQMIAKNKVKNTNMLKETAKRLSEDQNQPSSSSSSCQLTLMESSCSVEPPLPSPNNENVSSSISKKARLENEQVHDTQIDDNRNPSWDSLGALSKVARLEDSSRSTINHCLTTSLVKESVVTQTFQGQFRSTVIKKKNPHFVLTDFLFYYWYFN